ERDREPGAGPAEKRRGNDQCDSRRDHPVEEGERKIDQQCEWKIQEIAERRWVVNLLTGRQSMRGVEVGGKGRCEAARMDSRKRNGDENPPADPADRRMASEHANDRVSRIPGSWQHP